MKGDNEDPQAELENMRAILTARLAEEAEQASRYRELATARDQRVMKLTDSIIEIDAGINAIKDQRKG